MSGLYAIIDRLLECKSEIKNWLQEQRKNTPVPFYGSFDIRDAGWKVVVVDSKFSRRFDLRVARAFLLLPLPPICRNLLFSKRNFFPQNRSLSNVISWFLCPC